MQRDCPHWPRSRKKELEEMAEILLHVPANPPRTLHESLQFYWTVEVVAHYFARWGGGSGARFDQIWWPYFEADMKAGRIAREDALELVECVECLFLKIQEIGCPLEWPPKFAGTSGSNTLYTAEICGTTADGADASNDLSCIVMEALANLRLSQPPIALRYHPNIAPEVIETAINLGRTALVWGTPPISMKIFSNSGDCREAGLPRTPRRCRPPAAW
jgi:formate C-acetyltransferase